MKINIEEFQHDLVQWFQEEQRDLPWRKDNDPYKVWVSEVMLQQTRVDTVIPYYNRFLERFPSIEAFAEADEEAVLKMWEGLGYYSRVRNLHAAAKEVVNKYGGKVPDTKEKILKLKGVGPYTAGAVLSIAFGKPIPAVDGNVMRVLSRILLITEDIAKTSARKVFEEAAQELMYVPSPSHFNQALMELGALICTPGKPACLLCPVREHCRAFAEGVQAELPVKTRKKSTRHEDRLAVVLRDEHGRILVRKRPEKGLLANLWEFPNLKVVPLLDPWESLQDFLSTEFSLDATIDHVSFTRVHHVFTHLTWMIDAFEGKLQQGEITGCGGLRFVTGQELEELAFPVSHQKIWKAYKEKKS
ncbi:A/G-specific adenine glycosylase [Siminovitchia sediminis]|uniref:Adenine DNA glycosylase n=1 Tax=Siminovitchia sediminis TaxID=1274353 RepID=A0ABW4KLN6_9BACI